ncbi:hypothetical protein GCM10010230_24780 [Streptomyces narbonensis]|nr:hypothetical protein GCM10010230_24780 [Streptomyces narbonensis]
MRTSNPWSEEWVAEACQTRTVENSGKQEWPSRYQNVTSGIDLMNTQLTLPEGELNFHTRKVQAFSGISLPNRDIRIEPIDGNSVWDSPNYYLVNSLRHHP